VIATAGTTITPYMQIYLQSAVVERGEGAEEARGVQIEAVSGAIFALLVAGFIVIATGSTLFDHGVHNVSSAAQAARALRPVAGQYAEALFGIGLLGASMLAAAVLPITTAYVIAEAFGFEKGVSQRPREAPVFAGIITALVAVSAIVAIVPGVPVIGLLVGVQVVNGALVPVNLFFLWRLARDRELMGEHRSGPVLHAVAGLTALVTSGLSVLVLVATFGGF
jgi:Mn2+/Fe2+ NRAMP family transporter